MARSKHTGHNHHDGILHHLQQYSHADGRVSLALLHVRLDSRSGDLDKCHQHNLGNCLLDAQLPPLPTARHDHDIRLGSSLARRHQRSPKQSQHRHKHANVQGPHNDDNHKLHPPHRLRLPHPPDMPIHLLGQRQLPGPRRRRRRRHLPRRAVRLLGRHAVSAALHALLPGRQRGRLDAAHPARVYCCVRRVELRTFLSESERYERLCGCQFLRGWHGRVCVEE